MSGAPALEASTPAFAQTKPCRVRADEAPAVGAHELRGLVEHHLHEPRVLAVRIREPARVGAGHDVGQADRPALGLGDDLVGDGEHVAGPQAALEPGGRGASSAARSSPGRTSGTPGSAASVTTWRRAPADRAPRGCGRRPPACAPSAWRRAARSSGVSTSRLSDGRSQTLTAAPAAAALAAWRASEPAPNEGATASGGVSSSAFVPLPWRSGTIITDGSPPAAPSSRRQLARRRAPGSRRARAARVRRRARPPRRSLAGPPPTGRAPRDPRPRGAPTCAAACAASGSAVTTSTSSIAATAPSASSTSETMASASSRRSRPRWLRSRRCFARANDLTGRTAAVRTAPRLTTSRRRRESRAPRGPRGGGRRRRPSPRR